MDLQFPLTSPFLPERTSSRAEHTRPRARRPADDTDASHVTLHGAAAGAHAAGDQRTQLVVQNLPPHVRWQDIKDLFRRAGTVLRADVHAPAPLVSTHNGERRSSLSATGTVLFATEEDAYRAIDTLHGYTWHGRVLDVRLDESITVNEAERDRTFGSTSSHSVPPRPSFPSNAPWPTHPTSSTSMPSSTVLPYPGRVLFVGNLPFHCQWQDLKDLFRAAGNIQRADVALNADGRSRGFGTVLFASPEDAQTAVRLYHCYEYSGRILKVHFDRHALYGPVSAGIPTDPSQYTAAFQVNMGPMAPAPPPPSMPPTLPHGMLDMEDGWPVPRPDVMPPTAAAAAASSVAPAPPTHHPGRINIPPMGPMGAMTPTSLHMTLTPGIPNYVIQSVLETPPVYPYMMSPGVAFNSAPMTMGLSSYMGNGIAPPGPTMDTMHAPTTTLPPTPHWSQPPRPRAQASSFAHMAGTHMDTPIAKRSHDVLAPVGTQRERDESGYPFPVTDADLSTAASSPTEPHSTLPSLPSAAETQAPPAEWNEDVSPTNTSAPTSKESSSLSMSSSTRELTEAIAKLSVHGTARTKRTSNTNERVAAEAAMDRFRRNVAEKDPSAAATTRSSVSSSTSSTSLRGGSVDLSVAPVRQE